VVPQGREPAVDPTAPTTASTRSKPAILAVDDDGPVLAAVVRDLRRRYAARFRILPTSDSLAALSALEELALAEDPVALIVADQRMPALSGTELLTRSRTLHPDARAVLLTAYADTDAAIEAINKIHLDQYILKPWDPPEESLYPVLDELLDDWEAGFHPPFDGIRLVGHRWSAESHRLREFLARNLVPFRWLDVERDAVESQRLRHAVGHSGLPLVVLADGTPHVEPSIRDLAVAIGLRSTTETRSFDLLVVGAGPAGLAAAVYGASEGLRTAVLEGVAPGGQAGSSSRIENYLGFPSGVSGADLTRRAIDQARRLGAEVLAPTTVTRLTTQAPYHLVELEGGASLSATALIIATGVSYRTLDVDGADALAGRGVFYGASLHEARSYQDEDVVIVGGANSAGQAAIHFARFARSVTMVVRGSSLATAMSTYLVEQIGRTPSIVVRCGTVVVSIHGDGHLDHVEISTGGGEPERLSTSGLFIFIGAIPHTEWLGQAVERDPHGFVLTGPDLARPGMWKEQRDPFPLETSLPGVFAAGDVRARSVKRVASAVGDGAVAVQVVHQYLGL
jgi:thioredoxin reductase (NADPH)